ncbi:MAG: helix-turn-helix domain-containing protein [Actinomycetota bacterium]|nr:helix-turn-helix domain-containing protein [Actinomycetota bacterium]
MTDFDDLISDIEAEAEKAGLCADLRDLDTHYAFAVELIAARRAARMTQTLLAERAGVPQSEISRFERGQGNPTIETVGRLFAALGRRVASAPVRAA